MNKEKSLKGWATSDGDIYSPQDQRETKYMSNLPAGYYSVGYSPLIGTYFEKILLKDQDLIRVSGSETDKVINDIKKFWSRRDLFKKYKFPFKRGILMHGPPGCGKSCTISMICEEIVKLDGICIQFNRTALVQEGLKLLRTYQKDVPILVVMEDLDQLLQYNNISEILNMLDGIEGGSDNVIYLATTNNPEQLHENIRNRPSRFDRSILFGPPEERLRLAYLESLFMKEEKQQHDLNLWVKDTDGMSFAHLKELFISVVLFGNDYQESVDVLSSMQVPEPDDVDEDMMYDLEDQEEEMKAASK